MDELSKPTKDITFEDVQAFCKHGFPESQTLDYKSKLPENEKIADEVAAFANAQGGLLLFGVREEGLRPAKDQTEEKRKKRCQEDF